MSRGRGSILSMSKKQNLNTKSSTEAELIGADNVLPQMLWTEYFLESQGYDIDENIIYQGNISAMILASRERREEIEYKEHQAHQRPILFHQRQDRMGGVGCTTLSNETDAG